MIGAGVPDTASILSSICSTLRPPTTGNTYGTFAMTYASATAVMDVTPTSSATSASALLTRISVSVWSARCRNAACPSPLRRRASIMSRVLNLPMPAAP
ncbi:putative aryl-alcohol dehydrogenase AAD14 [Colletotrichum scovillei]|uniref:Aryl-alcohol dehydrogenase AAD14 n=1 Tax=Colletotrichum scovillei TaxID=1209932 RepID=A0A9P7UKK2_9PEZI|nr:putative aryl-alcohol dehydrogenase AAD14 [Colletotrichum scovillei]KAG7076747.1 putative aryl-alcohol dehydrogenase AAD14 [Colletotrichum scovillei]KAG7083840.1 putative aryl-alcohol dehydrogenase AAD14 [Colletotrichum scovillei]